MSVDAIDPGAVGRVAGTAKKSSLESTNIKGEFGKLLEQELSRAADETEKSSSVQPGFASFPVYEITALDELPEASDLREKGIRDTEQLIDILESYRQNLDRDRLDPVKMKETVQVLDQVSKDMLEYIGKVEHGELSDLMEESLVMARVEVEKFTRGDYS
jgi:hypothetical protein